MRHFAAFGAICFLIVIFIAPQTSTVSPDPGSSWSKTFGGENDDEAYSVIQTSDGGYVIAGFTCSYGAGEGDFWMIKTDPSGNEEWNKTFGGDNWDHSYSVVQTSDGGYALAGYTTSYGAGEHDFWLVKTDSSGNEEWNKTFGGEDDDIAYSLIQTADGGYALAGYTSSYGAGWDFWLVKTDNSGNKEWSENFGGSDWDIAYSIIQTSDGGYAIAGCSRSYGPGQINSWLVKIDNSGNEEWNKTSSGDLLDVAESIIQTSDGGYALAGYTQFYGADDSYFWLAKTDNSGNEEWNKTYGESSWSHAYSAVQTSDGGYALAGGIKRQGYSDVGLVKTDSSGNKEWDRSIGGDYWDEARSVIQTSDGGYALAGFASYDVYGNSDFWLIKTDSSGNVESPSTKGGAPGEDAGVTYVVVGAIIVAVVALAMILYKRHKGQQKKA